MTGKTEMAAETIIGLDLGGTKLLGVMMNRSAEMMIRLQAPTPRGNDAVTQAVIDLLEEMLKEAAARSIHPAGIAMGSPGFIDMERGMIVDAENLQVKDLCLEKAVCDHFHLPTRLYHDVKTSVLGEALFGGGTGLSHFAFLNLGTGVSVGLYLDGRVYRGANNRAGEIGHICLNLAGYGRASGLENRLEAMASGPALVRRAIAELERHPNSLIAEFAENNLERVTPRCIEQAALAGDETASRIIKESADAVGFAIGAMLDILDLERVILGGGVAQMGNLLLEPVQEAVQRYAIEPVPVLVSPLGGDAGAVGVVASYFYEGG